MCVACNRLKENTPSFVVNGLTTADCESLTRNRGLADQQLRPQLNNCETLEDLVDCLIGQHGDKLPGYNLCDIKDWLDGLSANLHQLMSAWVCNECGQWDELQRQGSRLDRMERILSEVLRLLRPSGAWTDSGRIRSNVTVDLSGRPATSTQNIATGNINLFGNRSENRFNRTNRDANNPQDIKGGLD